MDGLHNIDPATLTLGQLVELYLELGAGVKCPQALDDFIRDVTRFVADMGAGRLAASIRKWQVLAWLSAQTQFKSPHTRRRVIAELGRVFSWAMELEILDRNPFWRLGNHTDMPVTTRRVLTDDELRALMRHSLPYVKRLIYFVAATGCRPGEARTLRWADIDLNRRVAILTKHKTARKTRRPRIIVLTPPLVKMLAWMKRTECHHHYHAGKLTLWGAAELLGRVLRDGPRLGKDVQTAMRARGVSPNLTYRAARLIGAKATFHGCGVGAIWQRGERTIRQPQAAAGEFVFTHERGEPWDRHPLARHLRRLCDRIGLPKDVTMYCLRHGWATKAIRRGVPILLVSKCLGHARSAITEETYVHVDYDLDLLQRAAVQANGAG
jgi:integrase